MRYDSEHKQRTYESILREAASEIRLKGPDKVGVAGLMSKLGLTHGGFYAHFKSKDDLISEAVTYMLDDRLHFFNRCFADEELSEGLTRYIDLYLSKKHRDGRERGCPAASLASDAVRLPMDAQLNFEIGVEKLINGLADILKTLKKPQPKSLASSIFSEMVGTIVISRALPNSVQSDRLLSLARKNIKERLGLVSNETSDEDA
ncbi:TetR/AcrR family transcriptional regulator [Undibacterium sp. MH2W]|uniref:TetR/AcrR family transcriptional regulator n=1 Tax=Undibacterium sp. MH2W TaxID=3413044 RepID=UPI003BF1448E